MFEKYFARVKERRALRICLKEFERDRDKRPPSLKQGRWL